MANMSYCRFRNTLTDLLDCYNHLEDETEDMSEEELRAKKQLISLCGEISMEYLMEYLEEKF